MTVTSSSNITLRNATPKDAAEIAELGASVFSQTFGSCVTEEQLAHYIQNNYTPESIHRDITNPNKTTIVATNDESGEILGFAVLTRGSSEPCLEHLSSTVELSRLYVLPKTQGTGVGSRLMKAMEEMAVREAFEYIWLVVWEKNETAQRLYGRMGYEKVGDHDFDVGGNVQPNHVLLKKL